ncbi:MAG: GGDEF domain-containing protein [Lachnospiraceae bacterium]|nr:GGDEF domain-containing protein [Lachnospiraceae bacterium]
MTNRIKGLIKQYSQWFAPIIVFVIAVFIILAFFLDHTILDSHDRARAEIVAEALLLERKVESKLVDDRAIVRSMQQTFANVSSESMTQEEDDGTFAGILNNALRAGEGYLALVVDQKGNAVDAAGERVSVADLPWYTEIAEMAAGDVKSFHVTDDGLKGNDAVVSAGAFNFSGGSSGVCLYFNNTWIPVLAVTGKGKALMTIVGDDGTILMRSDVSDYFIRGNNYWQLIGGDAPSSAKNHIRRKDSYAIYLAQNNYTVIEVPMQTDVPWAACVSVSGNYIDSIASAYFQSTKTLVIELLIAVVGFFALLIILNVISKIRRLKESQALGEKADHDQLTGLRNKAATERDIQEFMDANPNTQSILFILDIDDFKSVNDTMGHSFGDDVLHEFGFRLGSMFRATDIAGRIGGDEFMVFVKNIPDEATIEKEAKKIREFISSFRAGEGVKREITASSGAAVFPADGSSFETLYKSADKALYESKRSGKRQLSFFRH